MLRCLSLVITICSLLPAARAEVRGFVGPSFIHRDYQLSNVDEYPLGAIGVDATGASGWGFHGLFAMGYSTHTQNGSPCCFHQYDSMLELHGHYAYRTSGVTLGLGLGLNVTGRNANYDDPDAMPDSQSFSSSHVSIGPHASFAVDLLDWRGGRVELVAGASLYSIPQSLGLCDGEISCERQAYTFTLALGFAKP